MGDGNSIFGGIAEAVKDVSKGIATEVVKTPVNLATGAAAQISGRETSLHEDEEEKQRKLAAIRGKLAQENMTRTVQTQPKPQDIVLAQTQERLPLKKKKPFFKDIATLQAVTKGETGRGHKG